MIAVVIVDMEVSVDNITVDLGSSSPKQSFPIRLGLVVTIKGRLVLESATRPIDDSTKKTTCVPL